MEPTTPHPKLEDCDRYPVKAIPANAKDSHIREPPQPIPNELNSQPPDPRLERWQLWLILFMESIPALVVTSLSVFARGLLDDNHTLRQWVNDTYGMLGIAISGKLLSWLVFKFVPDNLSFRGFPRMAFEAAALWVCWLGLLALGWLDKDGKYR